MMRRVGTEVSFSELAVVKGQYEGCIEEHLGVSKPKFFSSRLGRNYTVKKWIVSKISSVLFELSFLKLTRVVPRNITFRPLYRGRKVFLFAAYTKMNGGTKNGLCQGVENT